MLTLKYADLKLTKRVAIELTPYFSPGKSVVSEVCRPFTATLIKINYPVKEGDTRKALWGLLCSWLMWKQNRTDLYISYHRLPNVARNMCWMIQYYREEGQIDFLFYPPEDDNEPGKPYLKFSLVKDKITTIQLR